MTDRNERGDRLRKRFDDEPRQGRSDDRTEEATDEEAADRGTSTETEVTASVKDRPSVLMYLPEDVRRELDIRFDELNAKYKREHDRALEKNRDYYPAVVEAGLEGKGIEDVLEVSDDS